MEAVSLVNDRPLGPDANWDREGISNLSHVSPNKLVHGRSSKIVPTNMTLKETIEQGLNVGLLYRQCVNYRCVIGGELIGDWQFQLPDFSPKQPNFCEKLTIQIHI